jgi:hypothetical protein
MPPHILAAALAAFATEVKRRVVVNSSEWANDATCDWPFRYTSIARIIRNIRPGSWIAPCLTVPKSSTTCSWTTSLS